MVVKSGLDNPYLKPDPRYESKLVSKFINCLMHVGKKSVAQRIFYKAMDELKERTGQDPLKVFTDALHNATPLLQVKPRRVGGATYQVPIEVTPILGEALAMRWIITAARARKGMPMEKKLNTIPRTMGVSILRLAKKPVITSFSMA